MAGRLNPAPLLLLLLRQHQRQGGQAAVICHSPMHWLTVYTPVNCRKLSS
jgi:hypothetical protein